MSRSIIIVLFILSNIVFADVRLKDIISIENVRQESLMGYGLVLGLDGTGDKATGNRGAIFTTQTMSNMLERFGITVPKDQLRTRNVAAVMVTARTPLYGRVGSNFDVMVSSLGDATSLEGGVLLMAPLNDRNGTYYGQAQGPISVGGFNIETEAGEKYRKNHTLVGRVPNGGVLEKQISTFNMDLSQPLRLLLNNPDYSTASQIAEKINNYCRVDTQQSSKSLVAKPLHAGLVEVSYPKAIKSQDDAVFFISELEILTIQPDMVARVVINERTGTVVAGGNVSISEVMISHGSLTIHVRRTPIISQPSAFSSVGQTVVEYVTNTEVIESEASAAVIQETSTVSDLAGALNALGLRPRDVIAVFQAIKQAGALNAKLIII